jgi:3-hydroxyacyl-CoA dehydrogenase
LKRIIKKVAVLGSGIMGSRIACHFANIGVDVLLLDIAPKELTDDEKKKNLSLDSPEVKNRIVNVSLQAALKSNPSPIYKKSFASRIKTGNFTDNLKDISNADWIIEAVIENAEIKKQLFAEVEKYRKPGTLISSNTSGIPLSILCEGRSDDFKKHFCGTHFFNPPRYLRLLEIIPAPETDKEVINFLVHYGDLHLGKSTVLCKDTPAFIANRIGVYSIMALFHLVEEMNLSVEEVDKLTGTILGRPKSATFRTCDVVGLDTLVHVAKGVYENCPNDEERNKFLLPSFIEKMVANKWLGDKTGQGFYKKIKSPDGTSEILSLDLKTLEYKPQTKVKFATLDAAKIVDDLKERTKILFSGQDKAGEFYRTSFSGLFTYVSNRIPEVSDELWQVDEAMKAGFGWELGAYETWDILGVKEIADSIQQSGKKIAPWISEMHSSGNNSFYKLENGTKKYYDTKSKRYLSIPGSESFIILENLSNNIVWKNSGASLIDIGDGIVNLEFHTKMNTIGGEVLEAINKSIDIAEKDFHGLVIGNDGQNFSAGANLGLVLMLALEQEYDEIDFAVRAFQSANMRVKYASVPVVVAPHHLALGGGCEISLHAPHVQASAETYIGMVEFGVGLIPGGGGTKEFTLRASDSYIEGDIHENVLRERYLTIAMAKVATSAQEAFDMGILRRGQDMITMNQSRLISDAKAAAVTLADAGYSKPAMRKDIKVLGKSALGMIYAGAENMYAGNFISEHDKLISKKLAWIMCGGNLSAPAFVSEQYLLDLEREAFVSLCGEKKTLQRMESILKTGKPLRN